MVVLKSYVVGFAVREVSNRAEQTSNHKLVDILITRYNVSFDSSYFWNVSLNSLTSLMRTLQI